MAEPSSAPQTLRRELSLRDLVFFHVTAILSVRWIAKAAAFGPESLGLWLLAGLCFFLPAARAVTELSRARPDQGGIYRWTHAAFGPFHAFLCAWCYVISNLVYFPAYLVVVVDWLCAALGFDSPSQPARLVVALASLWTVLLINLLGLRLGRLLQALCAWGLWIPCGVLLLFASLSFVRHGSQSPLVPVLPAAPSMPAGELWSSLCFAFAGLELASSMGAEIREPRSAVPRSIPIAGGVIAVLYVLGTAALLVALPPGQVDAVTGIRQGLAAVLEGSGLQGLLPMVLMLLALGGLGAVSAWLSGGARIPFAVGLDRYLPQAMARVHPRFGTPHVALLWQGVLATAITVGASAGATVKEAYAILNSATTIVYFVPYLYLFATHLRIATAALSRLLALLGLLATSASVLLALVSPDGGESQGQFLAKVGGGSVGLILLSLPFYRAASRRARAPDVSGR